MCLAVSFLFSLFSYIPTRIIKKNAEIKQIEYYCTEVHGDLLYKKVVEYTNVFNQILKTAYREMLL